MKTLKRFLLWAWRSILFGLILGGVIFSLAFIMVQSHTDDTFTGQAECGVIFGAAVWRDDVPSDALSDRIQAGIDLYQRGNVRCLILSGGPSTYGDHEVDVMQAEVLRAGANPDDLILDYYGLSTQYTLQNLPSDVENFVMISQDFHLERIHLIAKNLDISHSLHAAPYQNGRMQKETYFILRETNGIIFYYLYFLLLGAY